MSETDPNLCEQCGGPLTQSGFLAGSCPRCMMEMAADSRAEQMANPDSTQAGQVSESHAASTRPAVIGRYRILRLVGQGGMGVVYEAEQDHPRRTVALKVIKPGLATPALLRRFEQESQALGRLQHPGIAQIYEAGTADTGFGPQPYFAMEFIRGNTVKEHAADRHLNTRQRLEMVAKIADAVQHAHQRGLIHRDLKPANILVDETGQPKVLDFGVARATDSDAHATSRTDMGQLVGTLAYMSPEQVLADPLGLDTRSDVYALGVILYELLAGRLPYTISKKLHETIHAIREEDPARLSAISRSYRGDIETIVAKALEKDKAQRYGSAAELAADITRYLKDEPIVARPPSTSYQLQKFARRHKALVAGTAAVFVVLAGGVVASTWQAVRVSRERDRAVQAELKATANEKTAQSERERAENEKKKAIDAKRQVQSALEDANLQKKRAETEAEIAKAVQDFLGNDLLSMANPLAQTRVANPSQPSVPTSPPNPNITVKELLDRAARRIEGKFEKKPLVEAAIREFIGDTYLGMGINVEAQEHFQRAVDLRRREQGDIHIDTLKAKQRLASAYFARNLFPEAEKLVKQIVEDGRHGPGEDNPATRNAISLLVRIYATPFNREAVSTWLAPAGYLKDVVDYDRRNLGDDNPTTQWAVLALVDLHMARRPPRYDLAETFLKELFEDQRRKRGDDAPATQSTLFQLMSIYMDHAPPRFEAAAAFLTPVVEEQRRKLGDDNPAVITSMNLLVDVYLKTQPSKDAEAETLLRKVLEEQRRKFGNGNRAVVNSATQLASLYLKQRKYTEAQALLVPIVTDGAIKKLLAKGRPALDEQPEMLTGIDLLSQVYSKLGKPQQADALTQQYTQILQSWLRSNPGSMPEAASSSIPLMTMASRAMDHFEQGRDKEGEELLNTVVENYRNVVRDPNTRPVGIMFAFFADAAYTTKGRPAQAEKLLKDVLDIQRPALGEDDSATINTLSALASLYESQKKYIEAEDVYSALIASQRRTLGPAHQATLRSMSNLGSVYENEFTSHWMQGNTEKARELSGKLQDHYSAVLEQTRSLAGGETSSATRMAMGPLGRAYANEGKYEKAEEIFSRVVAIQREAEGVQQVSFSNTIAQLAWVQFRQKKYGQAEMNLREALRGLQQIRQFPPQLLYNAQSVLGATLVAEKRFAEAEPLLLKSYPQTRERTPNVIAVLMAEDVPGERILQLYEDWGKPEMVAKWRDKLLSDKTRKAGAVRWQAVNVLAGPWTFDLTFDGTSVTGTVIQQLSRAEITDGKMQGNTISFKATSPDTTRTVTFTGTVTGSEISFTRNIQFRDPANPGNRDGLAGVFGMAGESQFIAKRVE